MQTLTNSERYNSLRKYANHLKYLTDTAKLEEKLQDDEVNKMFIDSLHFAQTMALMYASTYLDSDKPIGDIEDIDPNKQILVLLEHAKSITDLENDDDEDAMMLKFAVELAIAQSEALAKYIADDFKTLQNVAKDGATTKPIPLSNADDVLEGNGYKPTNKATKLLHSFFTKKENK